MTLLSLATGCATLGGATVPPGPATCAALTAARDSAWTWAAYLDTQLTARTDAACKTEAPPSDSEAPGQ
ncbi:hypothetical protein LY474_36075 [Myxococcus stipitatus]|uniref:hypothetical protein n=1 Tax=Myxococcus stipitatus TaxID=83455 RepID=UPI001F22DC99|nr:hypothetical protein [Myxococcus stipitatus]MCE9673240.1 hypothetical protein [Myxococcus stipitatus]